MLAFLQNKDLVEALQKKKMTVLGALLLLLCLLLCLLSWKFGMALLPALPARCCACWERCGCCCCSPLLHSILLFADTVLAVLPALHGHT